MYSTLFLFLRPLAFWIKFDTHESIELIPEGRQNLIDFCPICMENLGTKSTRIHKKHDLEKHGRTDKEKVEELVRGAIWVWLIVSMGIVLSFPLFDDIIFASTKSESGVDPIPQKIQDFIAGCDRIIEYYNTQMYLDGLSHELLDEINEGMGICFSEFKLRYDTSDVLAERYYNMTNSTQ